MSLKRAVGAHSLNKIVGLDARPHSGYHMYSASISKIFSINYLWS